jgi:hypothetical protein
MAETRPMRICDVCGQVDDHPRHVIAYADGDGVTSPEVALKAIELAGPLGVAAEVMAQISDGSTIMRHMDCCRVVGCPDGTCAEVTAGAEDKTGNALLKHLTKEN